MTEERTSFDTGDGLPSDHHIADTGEVGVAPDHGAPGNGLGDGPASDDPTQGSSENE